MGGIMNWVKNTIGLSDENEAEVAVAEEPVKEPATVPVRKRSVSDDIPVPSASSKRSKVVNINATAQLKVVVVQPLSYNDAPEIVDHLKVKKPVVVNLEKLESGVAGKIFDFLSGAVFALDGSMQKVSSGILLIVPNTMGIMGDFSDELKTQGIFDAF